jgi:hypothetical protein
MDIPDNFYKLVEQPGYLKHILYGDSVAKEATTVIMFKNHTFCETVTFDELWNKLTNELKCSVTVAGHEYIFIQDEFKTLAYDEKTDSIMLQTPHYLMRHKFEGKLIRLNLTGHTYLDVTKSHSMLDYSPKDRTLYKKKPEDMTYVPVMRNQFEFGYKFNKKCKPMQLKSTYYGQGTSKKGNVQITRKESLAHLKNIKPVHINSKEDVQYNDYVYDLSFAKYQNFFANGILVHNTDSIFLTLPVRNANQLSVEDRWKIAESNAEEINKAIVEYVTKTLLPRCNILPDHNQTFFKTEMLIDSAMFLDVKKNYAYLLSCKEGVVINPPKTKYTGIQVIKSDAAKLTQDLLRRMIEDVMLNTKIDRKDRIKALGLIVDEFRTKFSNDVNNYEFQDIGFPGKWAKKDMFINGMKIYNCITNEEVFNMGSSAKFIYCKFNDSTLLKRAGAEDMKTPGICVPYSYDANKLSQQMIQNNIFVDLKNQWDKLFTTSCHRVVELAKSESKTML